MRLLDFFPRFVPQIIRRNMMDARRVRARIAAHIFKDRPLLVDVGHDPFFTDIVENNFGGRHVPFLFLLQIRELQLCK
ncbi:hypothetical protein D3C85_1392430 [compost metagenome]